MTATVHVNALSLRPDGAGTSTYVRELLRDLVVTHDVVATVQADAVDELPPGVRPLVGPVESGSRRTLRSARLRVQGELFHGLDVDVPLRGRGPVVTTVQDLAVFDVPWAFSRLKVVGEQLLVRRAVRRADAVIVPSAFTAERVRERFGVESVVVPLAPARDMLPASSAEVRERYDLPERHVLFVGTVEPRKGVGELAEACRQLGVPLVVAGGSAGAFGAVGALPGDVRRLGFVPRADLPGLYAAASVVAYPSHYEGFGLPPVEALACGALVVCTPVASLRKLLGDAVAWAPVKDATGLAAVLREVLEDEGLRDALRAAAPHALAPLTWEATARGTEQVYARLL